MPSCERDLRDPTSSHDFGKDVIPNLVGRGRAAAHHFEDSCVKTTPDAEPYWRDVGTIDAYWAANLDLVMPVPSLDIYDPNWPIWTYQQQLPPAKFVFDDDDRRGMAVDSMVSGGCIISGAHVSRSLLFSSCRVNSHARTREAVVLPEVDVGRHARLSRVVIDRGVRIPEGMVIGEDPQSDARRFYSQRRRGRLGDRRHDRRAGIGRARAGAVGLDRAIAAAKAVDEGVGEAGVLEIKSDRIVEHAGEPCRRGGPAAGAASLVEPGVHDAELAAEPVGRHRDPHPHRKVAFGLALEVLCAGRHQISSAFVLSAS